MEQGFKFREPDMGLFRTCHPKQSLVDEAFAYDTTMLEHTESIQISKHALVLAQYIIYFKSGLNETQMLMNRKQRLLEASVSQLLTSEDVKKYKTKKDAMAHLILNSQVLNGIQLEIDALREELFILEGVDKAISEYIATFKRELTRRENELYQTRANR